MKIEVEFKELTDLFCQLNYLKTGLEIYERMLELGKFIDEDEKINFVKLLSDNLNMSIALVDNIIPNNKITD